MKTNSALEFKIQEIIARIRELRSVEGITPGEMARQMGMEEEEYRAYERGEEELNFGFLYTCAQIFRVDVGELIEGVAPRLSSYILTRAGEGRIIDQAHGMTYYSLADKFKNRIAEPLFVHSVYDSEAQLRPMETSTHEGQEFDIVIRGYLKVQLGSYTEILGPGDTIYYNSSTPHGLLATNGGDCDFYAIVLTPEEAAAETPETVPAAAAAPAQQERRIWEDYIAVTEDEAGAPKYISFRGEDRFNFAFDVVDRLGWEKPDKLAMLHVDRNKIERHFTFADMRRMSGRAANYFRALGIRKGDRVMLVLRRNWQFWPILLGLEKLGAVAIPAVDQLLEKDYLYRFRAAGVSAFLCTADGAAIAQATPAIEAWGGIRTLISVNGAAEGWHSFDDEFMLYSSRFEPSDETIRGDDLMMAIFTSGSTGITARYWHCVDPEGLHLTISDTGWAKAMWGKIFGQWLCEAAVFVYDFDRFSAEDILPMFARYRITTFCAPPTIYRFLIREDLSRYDLSSVRHASTAGEAMNPEVFNRFREATGLAIMEGFGQTETTVVLGTFAGMSPKVGSMGRPSPLYDVELLTAEGKPAATGDPGEICIFTGDGEPCGLLTGYWQDEAATAAVRRDGYYHTGDLAWRDEDGYFWYVGRADDLIKSSGYRIGPFEIESVLMELPYVLECGVSPAPDPIRGQVVKASIVLTRGTEASEGLKKEIQDYVKHRTAPYKYPRIVEFRDSLPKTASGKIIRGKL